MPTHSVTSRSHPTFWSPERINHLRTTGTAIAGALIPAAPVAAIYGLIFLQDHPRTRDIVNFTGGVLTGTGIGLYGVAKKVQASIKVPMRVAVGSASMMAFGYAVLAGYDFSVDAPASIAALACAGAGLVTLTATAIYAQCRFKRPVNSARQPLLVNAAAPQKGKTPVSLV